MKNPPTIRMKEQLSILWRDLVHAFKHVQRFSFTFRWTKLLFLSLIVGMAMSSAKAQEKQHLEVDLMISSDGTKPEEAWVMVEGIEEEPMKIEADYKGLVFLILETGKEYKVKVEAKDCLSKTLIFDTTDDKAKSDDYPCDVDLTLLENTKKKSRINSDIPVAVIRWHRLKRDWFHDVEYTQEMQKEYKKLAKNE